MKKALSIIVVGVMLAAMVVGMTGCDREGGLFQHSFTPPPCPQTVHVNPVRYDDSLDGPVGEAARENDYEAWREFRPRGYNSQFVEGLYMANLHDYEVEVTKMHAHSFDLVVDLSRTPRTGVGQPHHQYLATRAWQSTFEGGTVTTRVVTPDMQHDAIVAGMGARTVPDILPASPTSFPLWPAMGWLIDLNHLRVNMGFSSANAYPPNPNCDCPAGDDIFNWEMMQQFSWHGAMPFAFVDGRNVSGYDSHISYTIFNHRLFEERGVTTPLEHWQAGTWNWTQFVATAQEMTHEGHFGFTGWGLGLYVAPVPMTRTTEDGEIALNIDDPNYIRWLTEVQNLYQVTGGARNDWGLQTWREDMPRGIDAMAFGSIGSFMNMRLDANRRNRNSDLRVAPMPVLDFIEGEYRPRSPINFWAFSISSVAWNPVGAAEYMRLETLMMQALRNDLPSELKNVDNFTSRAVYDEMWAMIEQYENEVIRVMDPIQGVGESYQIIMNHPGVRAIFYGGELQTATAVLDSLRPLLQAEVDNINRRAEQARIEREQREAQAQAEREAAEREAAEGGGASDDE